MHHALYINKSSTHVRLWHTAPVKLLELEKDLFASAQVKATMLKNFRQMNLPGSSDVTEASIPQLMQLTAEVLHLHLSSRHLITNGTKAVMARRLYDAIHAALPHQIPASNSQNMPTLVLPPQSQQSPIPVLPPQTATTSLLVVTLAPPITTYYLVDAICIVTATDHPIVNTADCIFATNCIIATAAVISTVCTITTAAVIATNNCLDKLSTAIQ